MGTENVDHVLKRFKEIYRAKTDSALARAMGMPKSTLSNWRQRNSVPYSVCVQVAEREKVSLPWLLTGGENGDSISDSMSDSKTDPNRTKRRELITESSGCYESDIEGAGRAKYPIRFGHDMADFLAELARLTPEQQAQALEFIREKRRLNELEAKVSALAARR